MSQDMVEKVVPTDEELKTMNLNDRKTLELIKHAEESATRDHQMTVRQAIKKYKKAMFWSMILSTALIMEGYDVVIVCRQWISFLQFEHDTVLTSNHRSIPFTARRNFNSDSV